jgi:chaperonin GroES
MHFSQCAAIVHATLRDYQFTLACLHRFDYIIRSKGKSFAKHYHINLWLEENTMTIKPLADRVLVKIEELQEKTASGIYIPQTAQEKTQIGVVVAVGEGTDKVKMTVKEGDRVMHDKYSGTSVKADGQEYLILGMKDILAIIE